MRRYNLTALLNPSICKLAISLVYNEQGGIIVSKFSRSATAVVADYGIGKYRYQAMRVDTISGDMLFEYADPSIIVPTFGRAARAASVNTS